MSIEARVLTLFFFFFYCLSNPFLCFFFSFINIYFINANFFNENYLFLSIFPHFPSIPMTNTLLGSGALEMTKVQSLP